MNEVRLAIAGVGNCASALLQGLEYYSTRTGDQAGLMHPEVGPYSVSSIVPVAAFDIDRRKVGRPLEEGVFAEPNCAQTFQEKLPSYDVRIDMGPPLDGVEAIHAT